MLYEADDEDEPGTFIAQEEATTASRSVWDLKIYQSAHALGTSAHQLSLQLPKYELYETGS